MEKALIGMSGGVDSSVAAFLTQQAGYACIGATMRLFSNDVLGEDHLLLPGRCGRRKKRGPPHGNAPLYL